MRDASSSSSLFSLFFLKEQRDEAGVGIYTYCRGGALFRTRIQG